jgi:anti-sigma regulatory factor (Ser/Thr protein kinase)
MADSIPLITAYSYLLREEALMSGGTGAVTGRPVRPGPGSGAGTAIDRTSVLELAPLPGAIPCARLHAVHVLHEWGLRALTDDVALIVSELMTNAAEASMALPGRPPISLRLLSGEKSLVIEVWDQSPLELQPRDPAVLGMSPPGTGPIPSTDADAERGRGLTVVAALSERWGWQRTGYRHKVVWAELAR